MNTINENIADIEDIDHGEVYVLKNEAMPEIYKIGLSRTGVTNRLKTLNNTSVPYSFECIHIEKTKHCLQMERHIHKFLISKRISERKEFFRFASDSVAIEFVSHAVSEFVPKPYRNREILLLKSRKIGGPSQEAKDAGLKNLKQVSDMTSVSVQTLINWHKEKPQLFEIVLLGCKVKLDINKGDYHE